jgi:dihydroxy-acid dehydratase
VEAGHLIVDLARRYYEQDDETALPRTIACKEAFENAMTLDVAMGGSTNTVLHILAAALEGEIDFDLDDIDALSRRVPVLCKVAPSKSDVHMEDVHRAGGIMAILGELDRAGLLKTNLPTVHSVSLADALERWDVARTEAESTAPRRAACRPRPPSARSAAGTNSIWIARTAPSARPGMRSPRMAGWRC